MVVSELESVFRKLGRDSFLESVPRMAARRDRQMIFNIVKTSRSSIQVSESWLLMDSRSGSVRGVMATVRPPERTEQAAEDERCTSAGVRQTARGPTLLPLARR